MKKQILQVSQWQKEYFPINHTLSQSILRILAAVFGGYVSAYSFTAALVLLLPWPRPDVVFFSALFPCLFYLAAMLWAFAAPTAQRVWHDLLIVNFFAGSLALAANWLR